jgi:hypothetical protein
MRKKKAPKPNATQRELAANWERLQAKHSAPLEKGGRSKGVAIVQDVTPGRRKKIEVMTDLPHMTGQERRTMFEKAKSRGTGVGNALKKKDSVYTGTKMLGVSVLHKSNGIPVFRDEDIKDIARMRR